MFGIMELFIIAIIGGLLILPAVVVILVLANARKSNRQEIPPVIQQKGKP